MFLSACGFLALPQPPSSAAFESCCLGSFPSTCFCKPFLGRCFSGSETIIGLVLGTHEFFGFFCLFVLLCFFAFVEKDKGSLLQLELPHSHRCLKAEEWDKVILKPAAEVRRQALSVRLMSAMLNNTGTFFSLAFFFQDFIFLHCPPGESIFLHGVLMPFVCCCCCCLGEG